jgi:glutamine---fructose-6-phosphate transaminase (isomerizing)
VNAADFRADLAAKPELLDRLADRLAGRDPFADVPRDLDRVVLLGMGSSRYAAVDAALELRRLGIASAAEYASAEASWPADPRTLVVAISASGSSAETLAAVDPDRGRSPVVALVNVPGSPLATLADRVVEMGAGEERSGVACRSFLHTGLLLRALGDHLAGRSTDVVGLIRRVAAACRDLLDRADDWLPPIAALLEGPHGVQVIAPVERLASAEQGALMIREGPRRRADASETGDWSHVDVYLAKTLDYRALLFAGSRWDAQALEWLALRDAAVVAVGADLPGVATSVRYAGDDDPDLARYAEILVPELIAAAWWAASEPDG